MTVFAGLMLLGSMWEPAAGQQAADPTSTSTGAPPEAFITVIYIEPVNIRTGPSSFDYPIIGFLQPGETAPAIGRSPAGEWVQIVFPAAPLGKGWVYAANVELSPGALLPIVEPPPTPAPLESPTLNPTFVAAFQTDVPPTRLPTFTPPPPLVIPTFANSGTGPGGRTYTGWIILGLGLVGIVTLLISSLRRR